MIYVIRVVQEFGENDFKYTIKFGYTGDWKTRLYQYSGYFNLVKVLYTYPEGTLIDEAKVLKYLESYRIFKNEWFNYCPEVLEFFKVNDTIEKIREITKDIIVIPFKKASYFSEVNPLLINYILDFLDITDLIEKSKKQKEIEREIGIYSKENHIKAACIIYGIDLDQTVDYISGVTNKFNNAKLKESVKNFIKKFNKIPNVVIKLKALVEFGELDDITDEDLDNLFQHIPSKYGDYYRIIGPSKIRGCGYQESVIKQEFNKQLNNAETYNIISEKIYSMFEVGKRYSKSDIKSSLNSLYKELGYQKIAKATDLGDFFVIKSILTKGDRKPGFELLAKK